MIWIWNSTVSIYLQSLWWIHWNEWCLQLCYNIFSTILLCSNVFILKFQPTFIASFSEWVNFLSIYSSYNQVIILNNFHNYVSIFLYCGYFNSWLIILRFYPIFNVSLSIWKYYQYPPVLQGIHLNEYFKNYASILVYFRPLSFNSSHMSYSQNSMSDNLYYFVVYVSTE